jgi:excinuclease ABC subunit A
VPAIARHLRTLVDVGLGYVRSASPRRRCPAARRSGQAAASCRSVHRPDVYVLDEPTTGLHFEDIRKLLGVLGSWSTPATR